jgi:hypothetical protein
MGGTFTVYRFVMAASVAASSSGLSRRHRAWIALYTLDAMHCDRAAVLRQNNVTEEDLTEFFEGWFQLRNRPTTLALAG